MLPRSWLARFPLSKSIRLSSRPRRRRWKWLLEVEGLEQRDLFSVTILNNGGSGLVGLDFNSSGGYIPPDTCGAAGPRNYV
jgi:hypothetical protein